MAILTAYKIIRARWQEENWGFHEMKTGYHFDHHSHEGCESRTHMLMISVICRQVFSLDEHYDECKAAKVAIQK